MRPWVPLYPGGPGGPIGPWLPLYPGGPLGPGIVVMFINWNENKNSVTTCHSMKLCQVAKGAAPQLPNSLKLNLD